jgi:hypothetical protein
MGNICEKNQGEAIESNAALVNKKAGFQAVKEPGNHEVSGYIHHLDAGGKIKPVCSKKLVLPFRPPGEI